MRIAAGCDETAAREALTPAMIAWLCERAPEALVVETGGASVRLATAALLSSDEELDAFAADACWLAHAFVDGRRRGRAGRLTAARLDPAPQVQERDDADGDERAAAACRAGTPCAPSTWRTM